MRWSLLLLVVAIPTLVWAEPKVAVAPIDGDSGSVADEIAETAGESARVIKPARVASTMRSMGVSVLSAKSVKKLRAKLDSDVVIYGSLEKEGNVKRLSLQLVGAGTKKLTISFASPKSLRKELAAKLPRRIDAAMKGGGDDDDDDRRREAEARKKREEEERRREEERRAEERRKKEEDERRKREEDERRAERKRRDDDDRRKKRGDDEEEDNRAFRKKRGDDDDDDRRASRRKRGDDDDDRRSRKKRKGDDDDRRRKRVADRDDDEEDEDDDEERGRLRRRRDRDDGAPRHDLTQAALWLDAGAAFARRTLTYTATGMMRPPRVGTAAPAGRFEGEVYPAAFSSPRGALAGIGVFAAYSRTFALGIAVPGTQVVAPIKNGHYAIGGRYRIAFGEHSVALGLAYWRSYYMADRSGLMDPNQLDMPDVDYSAVAPGIAARIAATPKIGVFATLDVPLMLHSGPIQDPTSYGSSKILALDLRAGAQITVASHVALQLGLDFEQVGLSFTGQAGSLAVTRMVTNATDRSIGIGATVGVFY